MPVLMIAYSSSSAVRHFQQQRFYVEYPAVYYIVGGLNRPTALLRTFAGFNAALDLTCRNECEMRASAYKTSQGGKAVKHRDRPF